MIILFVDADVCVHADCLGRVLEALEQQPAISALFGAYDLQPTATGLVSQYRNLLHRYVHERDAGDSVTFWAGCGAVRSGVFVACGGFDETRGREALEDIDLGYRMAALGYRIVIRPEIQGTHLKRWSIGSMMVTDVRQRGIPWMRLLLSRNVRSATLNIRTSEQLCTVLLLVGLVALATWLWTGKMGWLATAAGALVLILAINLPLLAWFARHRDWRFALSAVPLRLLYYALNVVSVGLALLPSRPSPKAPQSRSRKMMVASRGPTQ